MRKLILMIGQGGEAAEPETLQQVVELPVHWEELREFEPLIPSMRTGLRS